MDCGLSGLSFEVRTAAGEDIVRIKLRMNWHDRLKIAKFCIPTGIAALTRQDGCPGGQIHRKIDGQEYPFFNYLALSSNDVTFAVVSRDVFAADVQPDGTIRMTLLRRSVLCPP